MAIYEILESLDIQAVTSYQSYFNGPLSQFLNDEDVSCTAYKNLLEKLADVNEDAMICVNLPLNINKKTISNQIIHYKDAFKLPPNVLRVPFILYWTADGNDKAIVFSTTNYIEAKGFYYCLTEPEGDFSQCRNEVLALCLSEETINDVRNAYEDIFTGKRAVGATQRYFDRRYIENVDEMKEQCIALANSIFAEAQEKVVETEEKEGIIYSAIARAFLIKKALYVQYMMSKDLLSTRHDGEIKMQRQFAKAYADEIPIVSLSTLWRMEAEPEEEPEENPE